MIIKVKTSLDSFDPAFVKVAVDIKKQILSAGCELHFDCAEELAKDGSNHQNLWGANIYPKDRNIEFTSLINIKSAENRSMEIERPEIKKVVEDIIKKLLI